MNNRSYDIETLKAYLAGKLDGKSMHALEKAALEDPFLADALEGLSRDSGLSVNGLAELQQSLAKRAHPVSKVPEPIPLRHTSRRNWWIAAAAVLLIGLGSLYIFTLQAPTGTNTHSNITQQVVQGVTKPSAAEITKKEDTIKPSDVPPSALALAQKGKKEAVMKKAPEINPKGQSNVPPSSPSTSSSTSMDIARSIPSNMAIQGGKKAPYPSGEIGKEKSLAQIYANGIESSRKVTMDDNAVKLAMAYKKSAEAGAKRNTNGDTDADTGTDMNDIRVNNVAFAKAKNTPIVDMAADSVKPAVGQTSVHPFDKGALSALKGQLAGVYVRKNRNKRSLNDVVVVGYGQPLKTRITGATVTALRSDIYPVGGLEAFDNYVADQLQRLRRLGEIAVQDTATVILQFTIPAGGRGKPQKIKILRGAGRKLDKLAKKIVQNGVDWASDAVNSEVPGAAAPTTSPYKGTYKFIFK